LTRVALAFRTTAIVPTTPAAPFQVRHDAAQGRVFYLPDP
jgi:hypothetical protein